jgi:magnesium chelatase family protein
MPPLSHEEKIEITQIYSAAGKLNKSTKLITERPFRTPHHGTSPAGLIGGGSIPMPGEISLAHKGILFLDEFTEFQRQVLDSLRQALEQKEVTISRARKSSSYPCDFTLIAACNPCPCGYLGDKIKTCTCNQNIIKKYLSKISGPIFDRIDLQIEVKRLNETEMINVKPSENSKEIKERVIEAREVQKHRYRNLNISFNSELSPKGIKQFCSLSKTTETLIKDAVKTLGLTARGFDRVLKVSRTIADLEKSNIIKDEHLLEALQLRLSTLIK